MIRLEARPEPSKLFGWASPLIAVVATLIVGFVVFTALGKNPVEAFHAFFVKPVESLYGLGELLLKATPLMLIAVGLAAGYRANVWNIGAEGQLTMGAIAGGGVALAFHGSESMLVLPAMLVAGAAGGMAWAAIPAYLQAKRGSHLVITTIMFNLLASSVMVYVIVNVLREPGSMSAQTRLFEAGGVIPKLGDILPIDFGASPVNITLILALVMAVVVWVFIYKTKLGYEFRAFGANPAAAENAGISQMKITMLAMFFSGAIAGMVGINIVMGELGKLVVEFAAHTGLVGLAVALMGRSHPLGIVLSALLFGALYQGGAEVAFWMPGITKDMIVLIQGLVIFFAGALALMFQPALRRLLRQSIPV